MESHARSIAKALSWRVLAFLITVLVVLAVTGRLDVAGGVGLADALAKVGVFYLHERAWNRVPYGREDAPEFEI